MLLKANKIIGPWIYLHMYKTYSKQNLRAGFAPFYFIGFMFHTALWADNKPNVGETTNLQNNKEAAQPF